MIDIIESAQCQRVKPKPSLYREISKAKRIIIITGAGVSVTGGIPDFRSKNGLYNLVKDKFPGKIYKGNELFDASLFKSTEKTSLFYHFIASLKKISDKAEPTKTHQFFQKLNERGVLTRVRITIQIRHQKSF